MISCAGLAAACGDNDDLDDLDNGAEAADLANEEGEDLGEDLADLAEDEIDGQPAEIAVSRISEILLAIDGGAIDQAKTELDLGADPVVRDFAVRVRDWHSVHDERVDDLLVARRLAPIGGAVSVMLFAEAEAGILALTSESLTAVDFTYLALELRMHAAAEELLDTLIELAPAGDVDFHDFVVATRNEEAAHRDEADALLRAW